MLNLLATTLSLDPITLDLMWTVLVTTLLLIGGVVTLARLPWSDEEIEEVDSAFRALWVPVAREVQSPARRRRAA